MMDSNTTSKCKSCPLDPHALTICSYFKPKAPSIPLNIYHFGTIDTTNQSDDLDKLSEENRTCSSAVAMARQSYNARQRQKAPNTRPNTEPVADLSPASAPTREEGELLISVERMRE